MRRYLWDDEKVSRERTALILRQSAAGFRERGLGLWWVVEREGGEGIGFCGLRPTGEHDPVYGFLPGYWDRGLATEAVRAVLRHAFESAGVRRITASADTGNAASLRVMEKAGMRRERRFTDGGRDLTSYGVVRDGYGLSGAPG